MILWRVALFLFLATFSFSLWGRSRVQGDCSQGGNAIVTQAISSTTKAMRSFPSCAVTVYTPPGTTTIATIYADDAGTLQANPFTADTTGHWFFHVDNGCVDVKLSGGGISSPFTLGNICAIDAARSTGLARDCAAAKYGSGSDIGVRIKNCALDLPATGGTIDARGFEGAQTCSTNPFLGVTTSGTLLLPAGTVTSSATCAPWLIPSNWTIIGKKGVSIIKLANSTTLPTDPGGVGYLPFITNKTWATTDSNIVLRDFTVDGNKANQTQGQWGIFFDNVSGLTIENVEVKNVKTYHGITVRATTNGNLIRNDVHDVDGDGIDLLMLNDRILVDGNYTHSLGAASNGVGIESEGRSANDLANFRNSHITIVNNIVKSVTGSGSHGILLIGTDYFTLVNNNVSFTQNDCIRIVGSNRGSVAANTCRDHGETTLNLLANGISIVPDNAGFGAAGCSTQIDIGVNTIGFAYQYGLAVTDQGAAAACLHDSITVHDIVTGSNGTLANPAGACAAAVTTWGACFQYVTNLIVHDINSTETQAIGFGTNVTIRPKSITASNLADLHLKAGASGQGAVISGTRLLLEGSGGTYLSLLTPNASEGGFCFGNVASNCAGYLTYKNGTGLSLGSANSIKGLVVGDTNPPHINQGVINSDFAFVITLAAGTGTKTWANAFTSTPVVVCANTSNQNALRVAPTTTNVVITSAGATDVIGCVAVGNPN